LGDINLIPTTICIVKENNYARVFKTITCSGYASNRPNLPNQTVLPTDVAESNKTQKSGESVSDVSQVLQPAVIRRGQLDITETIAFDHQACRDTSVMPLLIHSVQY